MMPQIETARLRLRLFTGDDLDDLACLCGDPQVMRYLGVEAGKTLSLAETEAHLRNFIEGWRKRGFGWWAVVGKETGRFLGLCGLKALDAEVELIYLLHAQYWGRGFASEAARASLRYGFEELHLERIMAVTRRENVASQRVMQSIGMRPDGEVHYHGISGVSYVIRREEFAHGDAHYVVRTDA
jgi:ribosomal-protein-alanine N-acetyltransferase